MITDVLLMIIVLWVFLVIFGLEALFSSLGKTFYRDKFKMTDTAIRKIVIL